MTKKELENKQNLLKAVIRTAADNGKNADALHIINVLSRLHRLETTLSRLAVDQCMHPVYDAAKQERLETLAEKIIADNIGCECYTQRDPRGMIIRMYLKDFTNSWDGQTSGFDY